MFSSYHTTDSMAFNDHEICTILRLTIIIFKKNNSSNVNEKYKRDVITKFFK